LKETALEFKLATDKLFMTSRKTKLKAAHARLKWRGSLDPVGQELEPQTNRNRR
jgi:hypothetical protein